LHYLKALAARYATLAASPESLALRLASDAAALDSTFEPASRLLFSELVDANDSVAARHVLARLARSDTGEARDLRTILYARTVTTAQLASDTSGDRVAAAAWLGTQWHRISVVQAALPTLKRLVTQQLPATMADQLTAALGLFFDLPVYLARGMLDSATAIPQHFVQTLQQAVGAASERVGLFSLPAPALPPDIAFFPTPPDSGALDSLIRQARAPLPSTPGQPTFPAITEARRLTVSRMLPRIAWFSGVLAITRGDRRTARRALGILDSLTADDTLAVRPLVLGLRAELALAADSGSVAESLLVQAIGTSVTRCPSRYRLLLARRYAATNHPELALRLAHSITMPSQLQPPEHAAYYAPALKLEGELLESLGRRKQAIATYQGFVDLRANADSALQGEVREVRARLAALRR